MVRSVDVDSFIYRSAYNLMIRLETRGRAATRPCRRGSPRPRDLTVEDFTAHYGYLVGVAPRPF